MVSIQCPHCEAIKKYSKIRDKGNDPLMLTCPNCSENFTATADELFSTLHAIEEKINSDF